MKMNLKTPLLLTSLLISLSGSSFAANRDAMASKYPDIEEGSLKPENKKILCPFHRMLERAGIYDSSKTEQGPLLTSVLKITNAAREFGCQIVQCGTVATAVSGGQIASGTSLFANVNLESLHSALGISHDCGLSFEKGGTEVSDSHRARTLAALSSLQDSEGHLQFEDLTRVKEAICASQHVSNTLAGQTEMKLIYSFLGGNERGFIDYSDVERFLNSELPKTIGAPNGI